VYTTTETFLTAFQFIKQGVDTAYLDLMTIVTWQTREDKFQNFPEFQAAIYCIYELITKDI